MQIFPPTQYLYFGPHASEACQSLEKANPGFQKEVNYSKYTAPPNLQIFVDSCCFLGGKWLGKKYVRIEMNK